MITARRRSYALIYVLAALPLIVVIGNVAVQLTGSALRAQRIATEEAGDDAARRLLVARMRGDARTAESLGDATEDFGDRVTFVGSNGTIEYVVADHAVTRTLRDGDRMLSETTWRFHHARCALRLETLGNGQSLVWLRFRASFQLRKNLPATREYVIALRVGEGGES